METVLEKLDLNAPMQILLFSVEQQTQQATNTSKVTSRGQAKLSGKLMKCNIIITNSLYTLVM